MREARAEKRHDHRMSFSAQRDHSGANRVPISAPIDGGTPTTGEPTWPADPDMQRSTWGQRLNQKASIEVTKPPRRPPLQRRWQPLQGEWCRRLRQLPPVLPQ